MRSIRLMLPEKPLGNEQKLSEIKQIKNYIVVNLRSTFVLVVARIGRFSLSPRSAV